MSSENFTTDFDKFTEQYLDAYLELSKSVQAFDQLLDILPSDHCNDLIIETLHNRLKGSFEGILPFFSQSYHYMSENAHNGDSMAFRAMQGSIQVNSIKTV